MIRHRTDRNFSLRLTTVYYNRKRHRIVSHAVIVFFFPGQPLSSAYIIVTRCLSSFLVQDGAQQERKALSKSCLLRKHRRRALNESQISTIVAAV